MSYDFHLICDQDPREGRFAYACEQFENKFQLNAVEGSENLVVNLAGGRTWGGLSAFPPGCRTLKCAGSSVRRWPTSLAVTPGCPRSTAPYDKDNAEAVRALLMITVIGTKGLLIDPQSNEVINAEWGA